MKKHRINKFSGLKKRIQSKLFNKRQRQSEKNLIKGVNSFLEESTKSTTPDKTPICLNSFIELHPFEVSPYLILHDSILHILDLQRFSFQEILLRHKHIVNIPEHKFKIEESPKNLEIIKKLAREFIEKVPIESLPRSLYFNEHRSQLIKSLKNNNISELEFKSDEKIFDWFKNQDLTNEENKFTWAIAGVLARQDCYVKLFEQYVLVNIEKQN